MPSSSKDLVAWYFENGAKPGIPSRLHELHAAFENEPIEHVWADPAQAQLRLFTDGISDKAGGWLDVASVECHQTMCEIQVVGNFVGDIHAGDPWDWQRYAFSMEREPWFQGRYDFPVNAVTRAPDGRTIYVTYFYRKPGTKSERVAVGAAQLDR